MSTTSLLTFADFEHLPDAPGKQELLDGELIEMPPAKFRHMIISERVFALLRSGAFGKQAHIEMGYRIGRGWLQPDVSVTRPAQAMADDYLVGSPDLAVEILSPTNRASHIERKLTLYFAEGASEVWVIDPSNQTMLVYRASMEGVIRTAVSETYQSKYSTVTLCELFAAE